MSNYKGYLRSPNLSVILRELHRAGVGSAGEWGRERRSRMALATAAASPGSLAAFGERRVESRRRKWRIHLQISCRKRDREQHQHDRHPYKVVEITPPPTDLGVRCFPSVRHTETMSCCLGLCFPPSMSLRSYLLTSVSLFPSVFRFHFVPLESRRWFSTNVILSL